LITPQLRIFCPLFGVLCAKTGFFARINGFGRKHDVGSLQQRKGMQEGPHRAALGKVLILRQFVQGIGI
jgi:DNA polymerase/3'-5' exonuclease PolX